MDQEIAKETRKLFKTYNFSKNTFFKYHKYLLINRLRKKISNWKKKMLPDKAVKRFYYFSHSNMLNVNVFIFIPHNSIIIIFIQNQNVIETDKNETWTLNIYSNLASFSFNFDHVHVLILNELWRMNMNVSVVENEALTFRKAQFWYMWMTKIIKSCLIDFQISSFISIWKFLTPWGY